MHAAGRVSNPEASENFPDSFQPHAESPFGPLGAGLDLTALTAVRALCVWFIRTPGFSVPSGGNRRSGGAGRAGHQFLDFICLDRDVGHEVGIAGFADQDVVFQAHGHAFFANVQSGFYGEDIAGGHWLGG